MKFFKQFIEIKLKKTEGKERINYLANRLIQEVNKQGYSVLSPETSDGFGSLYIFVFNNNTEKASITVERMGEFRFTGKVLTQIR